MQNTFTENIYFQHRKKIWVLTGVVCLFLPTLIQNDYWMHIVNIIGIYILLTSGLSLVLGTCGQISVGHAAFWGIGAYTSALLSVKFGFPFWIALILSGFSGALAAFLIGPVLRLKGNVLAVVTIAFGEIVRGILMNWSGLTNGPSGVLGIPAPRIGSIVLDSESSFYFVILGCVIMNLLTQTRLLNSRIGKIWSAIRDNELGAESLGVPGKKYKIYVFAVAGFWAGIAGSLYAHLTSFISPHIFTLHESVKMLTMVVVGGEGSIGGAVLGTLFLTLSSEYSRAFQEYGMIPYGVMMLLVLIFAPKGLIGIFHSSLDYLIRLIKTKIKR